MAFAQRCGSAAAFSQRNKHFTIQEMFVVSSRSWNDVFAQTPVESASCEQRCPFEDAAIRTMESAARLFGA
ncbi:MAG: hypothetical protein K6F46_04540 [Desulfovibrio sp.]|nr:hypothetical protein [Desulfovibrio sp.]